MVKKGNLILCGAIACLLAGAPAKADDIAGVLVGKSEAQLLKCLGAPRARAVYDDETALIWRASCKKRKAFILHDAAMDFPYLVAEGSHAMCRITASIRNGQVISAHSVSFGQQISNRQCRHAVQRCL